MTRFSPLSLRVLHAVRLLGFADGAAVAERADADRDEAEGLLREAEHRGRVRHMVFADLEGWSLTEEGRVENELQLSLEREAADPDGVIERAYREFLPLNARLLSACTDWQIKPAAQDKFAPNDHADTVWDERILEELAALGTAVAPLTRRLSAVLARFAGYDTRFEGALDRARRGQHDWVDKSGVDSCHRVWFQLHEDLVATLGIDRGAEAVGDR